MPVKAKTNGRSNGKTNGTMPAMPIACPVEVLMREHASLYRAKDLADKQLQEPEGYDYNPLIADWSPKALWALMVERIHALEEMARIERATSKVGVIYQLMLARTVMPVSEIDETVWEGCPHEEREAKMRENRTECLIDSAVSFLIEGVDDPDLLLLSRYIGPPLPMSQVSAIQNLLASVRHEAPELKAVS
ncbi:MAG: hypothetical protein AAFR51_07940 [Pseudomonadota bacterium]